MMGSSFFDDPQKLADAIALAQSFKTGGEQKNKGAKRDNAFKTRDYSSTHAKPKPSLREPTKVTCSKHIESCPRSDRSYHPPRGSMVVTP